MLVLLWTAALCSWAQHQTEYTIKGKITTTNEQGEKSPVPGAKIIWSTDQHKAVSKSDGTFQVQVHQLPDTLLIHSVGFEDQAYLITDPSIFVEVDLSTGKMLDGVEVIGENLGHYIDLMDPFNSERLGAGELRKAACCNLSESFETNASVDVNITDAVSGAKKIQMLGLDGVYTQLQWENIPLVRGLSTSYGLNFTPGTWIESIQITKGTGSVVNGYETMAGVINLELKKPNEAEKLYINVYGNKFGRAELNVHGAQRINDKWSTLTFAHAASVFAENDVNEDGFRDMPIGPIFALMHRWNYDGENSEAKFGFKATYVDKLGGQIGSGLGEPTIPKWGVGLQTEHFEVFGKNGYFFKNNPNASVGLIGQLKYHHMYNTFGNNTYEGTQKKAYFNGIYSNIIGNTNHSYKTGVSFILDDYNETFNGNNFLKTEIVPGAFFEYTYNRLDKFILVAGLRGDYHNLFGPLVAPRLHMKWNMGKKSALRLSTGRGLRVPNPYADYNSLMASNRTWFVTSNAQPEDCISSGVTFTQKFLTNDNISTISFDYFYTHFFNQLIADMDVNSQEIHIHNSTGPSFSHSLQAEINYKPLKNLELRAAFKYYHVMADHHGILQQRAFVPRYRVLLNTGYTTRNKKWSFDLTGNWVGKKRLPYTGDNPVQYQRGDESVDYWLVNSQLTYNFKRFSCYVGGENLLNVIQNNAIISADDPFGSYFDATQIWAPINGFNIYAGIHFEIKHKPK